MELHLPLPEGLLTEPRPGNPHRVGLLGPILVGLAPLAYGSSQALTCATVVAAKRRFAATIPRRRSPDLAGVVLYMLELPPRLLRRGLPNDSADGPMTTSSSRCDTSDSEMIRPQSSRPGSCDAGRLSATAATPVSPTGRPQACRLDRRVRSACLANAAPSDWKRREIWSEG
jgi:hypothetical protein